MADQQRLDLQDGVVVDDSRGFVLDWRARDGQFTDRLQEAVFKDLVRHAAWKPMRVRFKGIMLDVERGQVAISIRTYAEEFQMKKDKMARMLRQLARDGRIEIETARATTSATRGATACSIITVLNYNKYQSHQKPTCDTKSDSNATPTETPTATATRQQRDTEKRREQLKQDSPPTPRRGIRLSEETLNEAFERVKAVYPKRRPSNAWHVGRDALRKALTDKANPANLENIVKGAKRYKQETADMEDRTKVLMLATFINQRRWYDWYPDERPTEPEPSLDLGQEPPDSAGETVETHHGKKTLSFLLEQLERKGADFVFTMYGENALSSAQKALHDRDCLT